MLVFSPYCPSGPCGYYAESQGSQSTSVILSILLIIVQRAALPQIFRHRVSTPLKIENINSEENRFETVGEQVFVGECYQGTRYFQLSIFYLIQIMSQNPLASFVQAYYPENKKPQKPFLTEEKIEQGNSQGGLSDRERRKSVDSKSVAARQNFLVAKEEFGKRLQRMYKFPASVNEAKVHKRAFRNGYKSSKSYVQINGKLQEEITKLCPCCENFVNTNEIPLCYGTYPKKAIELEDAKNKKFLEFLVGQRIRAENVFQIQSGDALFFCFIKLVITYLIIRFLLLDVYNLYTNRLGHYCASSEDSIGEKICVNGFFSVFSTANKSTTQDQNFFFLYDILAFTFTILSILFFLYGRIKLLQLYELLENWDITEDDYTIMIEDIPHIPFERNDTLVKDLNLQYKDYLNKIVSRKIRAWLNQLYSYNSNNEIQDPLDQEFFDIFKNNLNTNQSQLFDEIVTSVNLCYDLSELENLEDIREKLVQEFLEETGNKDAMENSLFDENYKEEGPNANSQNKKGQMYISHIPNQIGIINNHYVKVCQKISETVPLVESLELANDDRYHTHMNQRSSVDEFKISRFVGKAFVSLRFQHYKKYLLNQFAQDKDYLKTNGNTVSLKLSGAQKPNDIYWKNMKIEDAFRTQQIISSYIVVLITVSVSFFIIYHLRTLESVFNSQSKKKTIFQSLYLITLPVVTFIINIILDWGLFILTKFERHKTKTQELSSLVIKNVFAKFMNTTVVYAFVYFFGAHQNPLAENGLVSILMSLIIIGGPLNMGSQIGQLYVYYKRWWPNRKYEGMKKANIFQIQLNRQLEDPPFDFAQSYSYYLQMVYLISFYGYMIPLATPIILVYFIFQYWIDKYNLLRRFSSPVDMGYFLTDLVWKGFEFSLLFRTLGHFVWGSNIHHEYSISSYICNFVSLILSVAYLSLSYSNSLTSSKAFKRLVGDSDLCIEQYEKAFSKFEKTYKTQNPATSFLQSDKENWNTSFIVKIVRGIYTEGEIIKRDQHFVPEREVDLERIWKDPEDRTVKYLQINDELKQQAVDFSTVGCYC